METKYTYEVFNDGYDIFSDGVLVLTQREPFAHLYVKDGSYEDNAKAHIEDLMKPPAPVPPTQEEKNRADIDYMALMLDIDLPSEKEEGE